MMPTETSKDSPDGWTTTDLRTILTVLETGSRPHGGVRGIANGVPSVGGEHLNDEGGFDFANVRFVPNDFYKSMTRGHIERDDILLVKDGATTGKVSLVRRNFPFDEAVINEHVFRCRVAAGIEPPFAFWFLWSQQGQERILENFQGSAQGGINQGFASGTDLPLAPTPEQKRIVAKVEQVLARVNAARERLAKVPTILKRFRQSVLAAAFSGRLTTDWRDRAGHNNDETAVGLPSGWESAVVASVCCAIVDCPHSTPKWSDTGEVCLRTTNFQPGILNLREIRYVSKETYAERIARLEPRQGDVLYSREGGILGIACSFPAGLKACLGQRMMLLRTGPRILPQFLMHVLNSPTTITTVQSLTGGTASPHLNVGDVKQFFVPVPSLDEQVEILRVVHQLNQLADNVERRATAAVQRTERLTQSVLAKAFRGELVPTEAELAEAEGRDYETAEELLERIRRERAVLQPVDSRRRTRVAGKRESRTPKDGAISNGDLPNGSRGNGQLAGSSLGRDTTGEPDRIERIDYDEAMIYVREAFAAGAARDREQAIRDVAAALGFKRVSQGIRDEASNLLRTAVRRGILASDRGQYSLLVRGGADYTRDHLIDALLSSINGVWTDRDEAIRATAHHLGFRRAGLAFQNAMRSAINSALHRRQLETNGPQIRKARR